jgi:hypothetical protein
MCNLSGFLCQDLAHFQKLYAILKYQGSGESIAKPSRKEPLKCHLGGYTLGITLGSARPSIQLAQRSFDHPDSGWRIMECLPMSRNPDIVTILITFRLPLPCIAAFALTPSSLCV